MSIDFALNRVSAESRIVVAMSGGVDSSVVAALAARTGAEVIGVTLQLYDHGEAVKRSGSCCAGQDIYDAKTVCDRLGIAHYVLDYESRFRTGAEVIGVTLQLYDHGEAVKRSGSCCAGQDIYDAKTVCDRLGIAHYVLDYESRFRTGVIDKFADEYAAGRTPVPCSLCNQGVKFVDLIAFARDLGADCLATGHYVRRVEREGRVELWKGRDPARDQSYFLYGTTTDQLDYLRFPLGDLPKSEVRRLAAEEGLITADKPDSQDICFVPDGDYASLVKKLRPETAAPGAIVHVDGRVLGTHAGVVHFTIGQRRGIEIGGQAEPLYVVRIEPEERRLVVGPRQALAVAAARIESVNWLAEDQAEVSAKVRSLARPVAGTWKGDRLAFAHPEFGVAPGQSAVFYDGERLLGGGTIVETEAAEPEVAAAA